MSTAKEKDKKFESALQELETLVSKLESEELALEDSLSLFEKGIQLSRICNQKLEEAEKKVDALLKELSEQKDTTEDANVSNS